MYKWLATALNLPGARKENAATDEDEYNDRNTGKPRKPSPITNPKHGSNSQAAIAQSVATRHGFKEVPTESRSESRSARRSKAPTDYFTAAQNLMLKMGLSLFPKRREQRDEDDALEDNTENMIYRNLDVLYSTSPQIAAYSWETIALLAT